MHLLLAGAPQSLLSYAVDYLAHQGFEVTFVHSSTELLNCLLQNDVDALLLDPSVSGIGFLPLMQRLRQLNITLPIIVTSTRERWQLHLEILDAGADYHLLQPHSLAALSQQAHALFETQTYHRQLEHYACCYGTLSLYSERKLLWIDQQYIKLSTFEFDILLFMVRQLSGQVLDKSHLRLAFSQQTLPEQKAIITVVEQILDKIQLFRPNIALQQAS